MSGQRATVHLPPAARATEFDIYSDLGGVDCGFFPAGTCQAECGQEFEDGDQVRRTSASEWMHDACFVARIQDGDVDQAWLLLADAVVRRPSGFRASDIRSVMQNVARIARRGMVSS